MPLAAAFLLLAAAATPDAEFERQVETVRRFHAQEAGRRARTRMTVRSAPRADSGYDVQHYDLALSLLGVPEAPLTLDATAAIRVRTTRPAPELVFDLVALDVRSVAVDGAPAAFRREPAHAPERLVVTLPQPAAANDELDVEIAWGGPPVPVSEGGWPSGMQTDDSLPGVFTENETDYARYWFPCNDVPSDKATLRMAVTVPAGWVVAGNGLLVATESGATTTTFTWATDLPIATYLVSLAAGPYSVLEDRHGALPLLHYVPRRLVSQARAAFRRVPAMFDAFEPRFGKYPFEKYGHATAPIPGGMENQTMTMLGTQLVSPDGELVIAHELAHQWWGDHVTPAAWEEIWLAEGFASFGEALWVQSSRGEERYRDFLDGQASDAMQAEATEGRTALYDPQPAFGTICYQKGGRVLALLRDLVGDDAFFRGLQAYATAHGGRNATTGDFRAAMEAASGRDLARFFDDWVYSSGFPEVRGAWRRGANAVEIRLEQRQIAPVYDLRVEARITLADGTARTEVLQLDEARESFRFCLPSRPVAVTLDPGRRMFWRRKSFNADPAPAEDGACAAAPDAGSAADAGSVDAGGGDSPAPADAGEDEMQLGGGAGAGCACGSGGGGLALVGAGVLAAAGRRRRC